MSYTINVNGKPRTVEVEADTPLLWVLRDELELKGSKFGCGMGLCGACTVHINGNPTRSCVTPVSAVGEAKVTTIEAHRRTARPARRCRKPGWPSTSCSAATARPARSCPPRRC